jgi:DNA-binding NarL/FixJ family response regulator
MPGQTTIVIADDHPIVRKGLRDVIEAQADLKVVAEADDGEAAVALIAKLRPRIAVLDLHMPKMDGFRVQEELRKRNVPVETIFLTMHNGADLLHKAMDLGGKGYILKESALVEIVNGIRSVAAGHHFVSPSMTAALLDRRAQAQRLERDILSDLTPSERRILSMIAAGKETKGIAAELHIHHRTVETHRANICQKLRLNGANSLLRFALEHRSELLA